METFHPKARLLCRLCLGVAGAQGGQTITSQCQAALDYCNAPVTGNCDPPRKILEQLKQRAGRCVEAQWLREGQYSVCDKGQENSKTEHFLGDSLSARRGVMESSNTHCFSSCRQW